MAVVIPALDPRYFTTIALEEYFVNKDTGLPLANGQISFFEDAARNVPKNVFTLVDNPPGYNPPNYVALPNPLTLSSVGTLSDNNGNNVPIYYFPYDAAGNLQLYYIEIRDQFGNLQETRHAWPNVSAANNPAVEGGTFSNALSNPQFVQALFLANNPLTITNSLGAGVQPYTLFPDWVLSVTWSGNGTIVITRTAIAGSLGYPGNPPYTITITPGLNITGIQLYQRLNNNPDIFSPSPGVGNGYISASLLLAPGSSIVNMTYVPNGQPPQVIIAAANNTTGNYATFSETTLLLPASNPATSDTGYVDIVINLPIGQATTLSNVQIIGLQVDIPNIQYIEQPVNRQIDQLFNYYITPLQYKQTPSYLVGWDFRYNPAQFLSSTVAASAAGANTSRYVWDQTISFQSANNGPSFGRDGNGAMAVTTANNTQFALIQYLPQAVARRILNDSMSVNISSNCNQVNGLAGKVTLWRTTDAALPSCAANNSIVATLDATGKPATFNGNWVEVPRNVYGDARFTIINSTDNNYMNYSFSGWDSVGGTGANTATFFAIVVGFATFVAGRTISFDSISLVPGNIPCRPAPQTPDEVLRECQRYYQKSFETGTIPAQAIGFGTGEQASPSGVGNTTGTNFGSIMFCNAMNSVPAITTYNPRAANAQVTDFEANDCSATATRDISTKQFNLTFVSNGATVAGNTFNVHWTADARLGR